MYSRHISIISVSCCSSRESAAVEIGMECRAARKMASASLNFPAVVSLCASFTLSKITCGVKRIIGESSLDFTLPSDSNGHWMEGTCGMPGKDVQVAQYASLKMGSKGSAFIKPKRLFRRPRASSNSPAATRSQGNFRFFSHLAWQLSPMVRLSPLSWTTSGTGGKSAPRSKPRSRSPPPQSPPPMSPARFKPSSSSPQPPAASVSSGVSSASRKASEPGIGGGAAASKLLFSKIFFVDISSGQLPESPELGRHSGVGGISSKVLFGMCARMSLPCSCSSSFSM
mmetsp:Transcript_59015/g.104867  ORF Transcript_59015/g.104867 Transcript_59015/m.104867 type:complete len:284 (-) Transcript_59015:2363-3214(-)